MSADRNEHEPLSISQSLTLSPATRSSEKTPRLAPVAPGVPPDLADHPRYRVLALLGVGGMGAVYQAEHRFMHRLVALKVIRPELVHEPEMVQRFRREVWAAARLDHPNIVTAHDADQAGDTHFLVLEYVEGRNLDEILKERKRLDVAEACEFARQTAEGLQYAFERGMVHRDIKPHNLMVTKQGTIKILDFGLARFASELISAEAAHEATPRAAAADAGCYDDPSGTRPQVRGGYTDPYICLGTADYVAPEEVLDARRADIRADIYSLGCTLYKFLAGEAPFAGGAQADKLRRHLYSMPRSLAEVRGDVPPALAEVVARMMAKHPEDRFATPAEVVAALSPFTGLPQGKVLVVEDDPQARASLAKLLAADGYQVATAGNGREALERLEEGPLPSLILLDLAMPVMNGWEFIQEQRKHPAWGQVPVVVISASQPAPGTAAALGAAEFLQKPIDLVRLTRTVHSVAGAAAKLGER
jgi:serine/threonine protein kinase